MRDPNTIAPADALAALDAVSRRLDRLERQNRWLRRGLIAGVVAMAAAAAAAQAPPARPAVTAGRIALVDADNHDRAVLESVPSVRGTDNPILTFFDQNGRPSVRLGISDRGPVLDVQDRDGKWRNLLGGPVTVPATSYEPR